MKKCMMGKMGGRRVGMTQVFTERRGELIPVSRYCRGSAFRGAEENHGRPTATRR